MPFHRFATLLILVIAAAGLTVWIATALAGSAGLAALIPLALVAWGIARLATRDRRE